MTYRISVMRMGKDRIVETVLDNSVETMVHRLRMAHPGYTIVISPVPEQHEPARGRRTAADAMRPYVGGAT